MCHVHTDEEMVNILETLADLFAWKRRAGFIEAAAVLRSPSRQWRKARVSGGISGFAAGNDAGVAAGLRGAGKAPAA